MPIIEGDSGSGIFLTEVDLAVTASLDGSTFLVLKSTTNLTVTATLNPSVYFDGESETDMAVNAAGKGKLAGEPDSFGETEADLAVTGTLDAKVLQIGNTQADLAVTATLDGYVTEAEQFVAAFIADLVPDAAPGRSERRAILTVDGEEIEIKEAEWIEDEGRIDHRLVCTIADPADRALITKDSSITFSLQRKIAGDWETTTVLLVNGEVDETTLEYGRQNGAPADQFSFTGQTPLQVRFNRTPITDLIMFDPQKLTLQSADFDVITDTNGQTYEVELLSRSRLKMNQVFDEIFRERMGFSDWHSDLPDEFIELPRVDFRGGQPYILEISGIVGFFNADYQLIGDEIWIKDGTVEHPSSLPVRQVTIRGGKLKQLAKTEKYERYDGVDLTYRERQLEYDFVTTRVETPPPSTVDVAGWVTSTQISRTIRELRRNSQPDRIIDEKVINVNTTVAVGQGSPTTTIEERSDRRVYDLYGNLIRRFVDVDARIPSLSLPGTFIMDRVRDEEYQELYRGHPFERDKIYRYRALAKFGGLITVDTANPQLGMPAKQDISTAYRSLNLAEGQTLEYGPVEHVDEQWTPLRDDQTRTTRQRVHYPSQTVENDVEETKVGSIAISTLVAVQKQIWVFERGVYTRTPDKMLPLDAGDIPLRFAQPCARRHLSMLRSLPKRVSATAIDFDESIVRGTTVNFRGRDNEDLGIHRILSRRLSIRRMAWTASYTARQVGVASESILVDNEAPFTPGEIALNPNEQVTFTIEFECLAGYFLRCTSVADILVEARAVGDVSWIALESTPIDLTPYALTVQPFEIRLTTGAITEAARREFRIYASL